MLGSLVPFEDFALNSQGEKKFVSHLFFGGFQNILINPSCLFFLVSFERETARGKAVLKRCGMAGEYFEPGNTSGTFGLLCLFLRVKSLLALGTHQHPASYFMLFWATPGLNGQVVSVTRQEFCSLNSIVTPFNLQKKKAGGGIQSEFSALNHQLGSGQHSQNCTGYTHQTF